MFPQGGPGIGLLILRIAVAGMFLLNLTHRFNFSSNALHWFLVLLIGLISLGLLLGFFTLILSIVAGLAAVVNLLLAGPSLNVIYLLALLTSAALFFLGPGAYSVDARLFGLRVTVVPPRKDKKTATTSIS
jgi:signal transduction histidine kinase